CVQGWFGSLETFEHYVRTDVRRALRRQLANEAFSYRRIAQGSAPVLWVFVDWLVLAWVSE
ncbi:unnamed protein product, partial [Symbiodinium pilosum]